MKIKILALALIVLSSIILNSCRTGVYTQAPSYEFSTIINDSSGTENGKLNFNGAYHFIEESNYNQGTDYENGKPTRVVAVPYLDKPVFFLKNNLMFFDNTLSLDSSVFFTGERMYGTDEKHYSNNWGTYKIENNVITAIFYYPYVGGNLVGKGYTQRLLTYFQGNIKNRDTITDWHMIPPYPNISSKANQYEFNSFMTPRELYFKKVPIDKLINPDSAWINKFKNK
jgi:hypothetical protein